jgi:hypothetical protein
MAVVAKPVRRTLFGLAAALVAGVAAAHDYVVVKSGDPAIAVGRSLDGGQRLALGPGRTVTLMHATGDIVLLKGAADGVVVVPQRKAAKPDAERLEMFRMMVSTDTRQVSEGLGRRRTRGGVCPAAASLTTLEAIAEVEAAGCAAEASDALDAWIDTHPAETP